jgi:transposase
MNLEIFIPKPHLCRIVDLAVEKNRSGSVCSLYPGVGPPAYHLKMMLKVILYAYANRIYSSRQIAKQLKKFFENG